MQIAIVGCGFVADFYLGTLPLHPELELIGVTDRDPERARAFSAFHCVPAYAGLDELLADARVSIVLNLTNPHSHYEVTRACLLAGKHVYSEKPLAMEFAQARELAELAAERGLELSGAPCSLLNEAAQSVWKALREGRVGTPRLVYAELDDGMVHQTAFRSWASASGIPWPYLDEFRVGCTVEHAGYAITWLTAFFGPAETVTAFSSLLVPEKLPELPKEQFAPDFSVACIRFHSGVVARLTCSIVAPHDHSLRIVGDAGVLYLSDLWHDRARIYTRHPLRIRRRTLMSPWRRKVPLVGRSNPRPSRQGAQHRNFCQGVADLAEALRDGRSPRLSRDYCLHITELALAIQNARDSEAPYRLTTRFEPIDPMRWAL